MRYGNSTKVGCGSARAKPLASLARAVCFNHPPVVRPHCSRRIVFAPRTPRTPSGVGGHSVPSESFFALRQMKVVVSREEFSLRIAPTEHLSVWLRLRRAMLFAATHHSSRWRTIAGLGAASVSGRLFDPAFSRAAPPRRGRHARSGVPPPALV